ncbi:MAG TPA: flavodoxin family protein [Patescibacteria group bacterium]|nr:flavodoxin family protein [Patescibacteria group bacterium]
MNSLVIYDSNYGSTKKIAQTIAEKLEAEIFAVSEITDDQSFKIDLLVVGSPVNAFRPSKKMLDFLDTLKSGDLENIKAAAFDTRVKLFIHGDAAGKISKKLAQAGAEMVASPQAFYVKGKEGPLFDGEIEKAQEWAEDLKNKI